MPDPASAFRRLSAAVVLTVIAAAATASSASASTYGEITHFGSAGSGAGQFEPSNEAAGIGVDPTDNSVYTVDLPDEKGEFRLQKWTVAGGKYSAVASVKFKPHDAEGKEEPDVVEGVAVDPSLKRVYVLAAELRPNSEKKIDPEVTAASQLFAFSTEQSGSALVPVTGTEEGVLAGVKVLTPTSNKYGASLLEPEGITVDPTTHDIIVLGFEDTGVAESEPLLALERISDEGKLGARWVDSTDYFEGEGGNSPVVTKNGTVLVDNVDEIDKIPSNFSEKAAPVPLVSFEGAVEHLVQFPGTPADEEGGGLAVGSDGTIYTKASVVEQLNHEKNGYRYPGILELTEAGVEKGWTGGQSVASDGEGGACQIPYSPPAAEIAAGKEGDVFVFSGNSKSAKVSEFGPGGSGCLSASATEPVASVGGNVVAESVPIPIADNVTLSSTLYQANALSVEWNFGDGSPVQTVNVDQHQSTEVTHKFIESSETPLEVTETIHTDDLAEPVIVVHSKILIHAEEPTVITSAASPVGNTTATLKGSVNPNGGKVILCEFEYGPTTSYGTKALCSPKEPGSGANAVPVSAAITGLTEHTAYHYRLVAKNSGGEKKGSDQTFTTGPKPTAVTGTATGTTLSGSTLNASVNPEGAEVTDCHFDYGTSTSYELTAPCSSLPGKGKSPVAVFAGLSGLSQGTTYHYTIVAVTASGTAEGEDATFTTGQEQAPSGGGGGGGGGGTNTTPTQTTTTPQPTPPPPPAVSILGATTVSTSGAFTLKLSCPAAQTSCVVALNIKTLKAVVAALAHGAKGKPKAAILTLAAGSATLAGGQVKTITLKLSSAARALLAKTHSIGARVTVIAGNPQGESATTSATLTLRPAKPTKKK